MSSIKTVSVDIMRKNYLLVCVGFILVVFLSACVSGPKSANSDKPITQASQTKNATTNLNLGLLSNLIGDWKIQDWQLQKNGKWQEQAGATWSFFAIQGGAALRDEWKSNTNDIQQNPGFGSQLRVYNPWNKTWSAAWLSSRTRNIEFYSGNETESEVFFVSQPNQKGRITRVTFSDIKVNSFEWKMQWSLDTGKTWTTIYKVEAKRIR